jgi:hypothetical protein
MMARKKRHRKARRRLLWLCSAVLVLLLSGICLVLSGVPGTWVSAGIHRMTDLPGRLELTELIWQPGNGWVIRGARWFSPRDLSRPLFVADLVTVESASRRSPVTIRIEQGRVTTNAGVWTRDLTTRHPLEVTGIQGAFSWSEEEFRFSEFQCVLSGVLVRLQGVLEAVPSAPDPARRSAGELLADVIRPLVPVLQGLQTFSSDTMPEFNVRMSGSSLNPTLELSLLHPHPFDLRGDSFSSLHLAGRLEDRTLSVERAEVTRTENEWLKGSSQIDFRNQMFDLQLDNTLGREALEALSPFSLDGFLSSLDLRVEGKADFHLDIGPASFSDPGERVSGSFQVRNVTYRDAFFEEAEVELELDGSHLRLPQFSGRLGDGGGGGNITGNMELDSNSGLFRLSLTGNADPDEAVSLVGPDVEALIREWEFQSDPPELRLEVNKPDTATPLQLHLVAKATDAVWRGTLFHQIRAVTTLDGKGLRVRELLASRGPLLLEGSLEFPRTMESCTFTLNSSFPLPDILPLLGREAMEVIRPIRFQGATEFSASGTVDLSGNHRHRLTGRAVLKEVIFNWILFNQLSGSFILEGQQLELPDIEGRLVEGQLSGELRLQEAFSTGATFYTDLEVRDVDLFELITKATDQSTTPYTGTLNLDLQLQGALHNTPEVMRERTFDGEGRVEIRKGQLFRIPLLLGLSNILSKVVRGFGYASQGDFDADFVINDGKVSSDNIFLGGSFLSIAGDGSYEFNTRKLSGNVKVQLLKEGFMSDALKVLLWPIRTLIEVQLTGTLDNPDWRPRNLPKELFGK